ncbi:unnamed protein product [Aphanomyces euteiches]
MAGCSFVAFESHIQVVGAGGMEQPLSEYEAERAAKIARNKAMLASLGIEKIEGKPNDSKAAMNSSARRDPAKRNQHPKRRSARVEKILHAMYETSRLQRVDRAEKERLYLMRPKKGPNARTDCTFSSNAKNKAMLRESGVDAKKRYVHEYQVTLKRSPHGYCMNLGILKLSVCVVNFFRPEAKFLGPAEACGKIQPGDKLFGVKWDMMLSEYEQERLAKIARNKAMLGSLGIESLKEDKPQKKNSVAKKIIDAPLRRSARVKAEMARRDDETIVIDVSQSRRPRRSKTAKSLYVQSPAPPRRSMDFLDMTKTNRPTAREPQTINMIETAQKQQQLKLYSELLEGVPTHTIESGPKVSGISTKELDLVVPSDEYIGHALYPVGKLATMMWLCPGYHPKFSLLQSHQVWTNAMVIFINIDLNDRYTNDFLRNEETDQLFIVWFARTSLTEENPVIQQLIHGPKSSASPKIDPPAHEKPTLLFFRFLQVWIQTRLAI